MSVLEPTDLTGREVLSAFRKGTTQVSVKSSDDDASLTPVISPATNLPVCWFVPTPNEDIDAIVQEAEQALNQPAVVGDDTAPAWSDPAAGPQRAAVLQKWAALLRQHVNTLARLEVQQIGRPYKEMRFQLSRLPEWFDYFAAMIITHHDQVTPWKQGGYLNVVHRVPLGVVANLTPWNHPLLITIKKLAPALAAGNAVVIKPSELAPASIIALVQLGHQAGVPPGIVNVILGAKDQAQCLIRHPTIAKVDFTGGPATGRAIGAAAGENLASVTQELGGKAPMIVCAPKHVEQLNQETIHNEYLQPVVNGCAFGAFIASGQTCIAGTRLLVDARWYQDFLDKLVAKTRVFRLGDPLDLATTIGPVITKKQTNWIHETLQAGIEDSGSILQILCGGKKFDGLSGTPFAEGNYYEPTIVAVDSKLAKGMMSKSNSTAKAARDRVAELHHSNSLFQTELFGPVVVVAPFYDTTHAIEMANDTAFGLGASIWSHDLVEAQSLASKVRSGIVWINDHHKNHPSSPWGGLTKASGIGRENGHVAFLEYSQAKSVVMNCRPFTSDWFQDPNARYN
uniref:Aldehyde dehydrogenase domain-containing protein n=1 Tax=Amphora coffeiformis TaxID=265554 RepID=A0A7S3PDM5_9STRA|mmetsp:Transcript_8371/g.15954  ORF Transcript_8371/g.15954 Transcript_8371/m.15954 type:complete len:568 (+) Transcript_8371:259-1962(+)